MILEFFLYTLDRQWFTREKLGKIERSTNYILENLRSEYNPALVESGIEGDWTENTDWHADNSINKFCMVHCLDQLVQVESILGRTSAVERYGTAAADIRSNFQMDASEGGFWQKDKDWFLHGNDGVSRRIYGDKYFDSTANYFSILWGVADEAQGKMIWSYVDHHPEIEEPLPVLTNHMPRNFARRMNYGHTITDGDVWLTLGAHAATARLKAGYRKRATKMYKAIIDFERRTGTIHNAIFQDGTADEKWSPEIGNYGSIFTPLVEGVIGFHPRADGLWIEPIPLEGMRSLEIMFPLSYAGKSFFLRLRWKGGTRPDVSHPRADGKHVRTEGKGYLLMPDFEDGSHFSIVYH